MPGSFPRGTIEFPLRLALLKLDARHTVASGSRRREAMGAPATRPQAKSAGDTTLLELVQAVADVTSDEREIIATVMFMLRSGHARLTGTLHDEPIDDF